MSLISVVMGCTTSKDRFSSARQLLDYGFNGYVMYETGTSTESLLPIKVIGGVKKEVIVETDAGGKVIVKKGSEKNITEEVDILPQIEAPVEKGQKLGEIRLSLDGEELAKFTVTAGERCV